MAPTAVVTDDLYEHLVRLRPGAHVYTVPLAGVPVYLTGVTLRCAKPSGPARMRMEIYRSRDGGYPVDAANEIFRVDAIDVHIYWGEAEPAALILYFRKVIQRGMNYWITDDPFYCDATDVTETR